MGERKILGSIILITIIICIFRLTSDWGYINVAVKYYKYQGYCDYSNLTLLGISWICLMVTLPLVYKIICDAQDRVSSIVIVTLYLVSYVPFTTCVYYGIMSKGVTICNMIYWMVLLFAQIMSLSYQIKPFVRFRIGNFVIGDRVVMMIGFFSMFIVVYISARYTNFRLNFDLLSVYSLRAEAKTYGLSTVMSYIFSWTKAINPILFGYCLINRKWKIAILFFTTQMLSFGIDGQKSTFFMPILVIGVVCLYNKISIKNTKRVIVYGVGVVGFLSVIEPMITKTHLIILYFTRRLGYATNLLHECYYDFFSKNTPDFFRGSFLRFIGLKTPYENLSLLIGNIYFNKDENCNNGLVSDAFTNVGMIGIIIMPILVVFFLRLFDRSSHGLDRRLTIITALYLTVIFLSSFISTILLTHGMLVIIILLSMLNRNEKQTKF